MDSVTVESGCHPDDMDCPVPTNNVTLYRETNTLEVEVSTCTTTVAVQATSVAPRDRGAAAVRQGQDPCHETGQPHHPAAANLHHDRAGAGDAMGAQASSVVPVDWESLAGLGQGQGQQSLYEVVQPRYPEVNLQLSEHATEREPLPKEIEIAKTYLKKTKYANTFFSKKNSWSRKPEPLNLSHLYTPLNMMLTIVEPGDMEEGVYTGVTLSLQDMFKPHQKHILIEGDSGTGKTTFCRKIRSVYANDEEGLEQFTFVFFLESRSIAEHGIDGSIRRVFPKFCNVNNIMKWIEKNPSLCLFILDSVEKLQQTKYESVERNQSAWAEVISLAEKILYPGAYVMYTSRLNEALELHQYMDCMLLNRGFQDTQVREYIGKRFTKTPQTAKSLIDFIYEQGDTIADLVKNPLNLSLLCTWWPDAENAVADGKVRYLTRTDLFQAMTRKWELMYCKENGMKLLNQNIPPEMMTEIKKIAELAYHGCQQNPVQDEFDHSDLAKFGISEESLALHLGYFSREYHYDDFTDMGNDAFSFSHGSMQDFFAAKYIMGLEKSTRDEIFQQINGNLHLQKWLQFCFGLGAPATILADLLEEFNQLDEGQSDKMTEVFRTIMLCTLEYFHKCNIIDLKFNFQQESKFWTKMTDRLLVQDNFGLSPNQLRTLADFYTMSHVWFDLSINVCDRSAADLSLYKCFVPGPDKNLRLTITFSTLEELNYIFTHLKLPDRQFVLSLISHCYAGYKPSPEAIQGVKSHIEACPAHYVAIQCKTLTQVHPIIDCIPQRPIIGVYCNSWLVDRDRLQGDIHHMCQLATQKLIISLNVHFTEHSSYSDSILEFIVSSPHKPAEIVMEDFPFPNSEIVEFSHSIRQWYALARQGGYENWYVLTSRTSGGAG